MNNNNIKNLKYFFVFFSILLLFSSCIFIPATEPKLQYVYDLYGLNFNSHEKVYTKHNLWYHDPMNIEGFDYMSGKILPVGAEINFLESYPGYVIFETTDGMIKFKIYNNQMMTLLTDQALFHRIFTEKNPLADLKNMNKIHLEDLKKGKIYKGMTRDEVLLAYGPPPKLLNPAYSTTTWMYVLDDQYKIRHVVFKDDVVIYVFDC